MYASAFVLGFHGCDKRIGEAVLAGKKELRPSENDHDWLGHGIYFWENSPLRAQQWARLMADRHGNLSSQPKEPFVIGAVIDLGHCLDLTEAHSLDILKSGHFGLTALYHELGVALPKNEPGAQADTDLVKRKLDCAVINYVHEIRALAGQRPFDSVRSPFLEGEPLYEGAGIRAKNHIQICVRKGGIHPGLLQGKSGGPQQP
jgi:hypothetical protein